MHLLSPAAKQPLPGIICQWYLWAKVWYFSSRQVALGSRKGANCCWRLQLAEWEQGIQVESHFSAPLCLIVLVHPTCVSTCGSQNNRPAQTVSQQSSGCVHSQRCSPYCAGLPSSAVWVENMIWQDQFWGIQSVPLTQSPEVPRLAGRATKQDRASLLAPDQDSVFHEGKGA